MPSKKMPSILLCSFCGEQVLDEHDCISGIDSTICRECLEVYYHIMDLMRRDEVISSPLPLMPPQTLYQELNKHVIGQHQAKKTLAVAIYNHCLRLKNIQTGKHFDKSNILMIGPSGSGKTLLAKTLADLIDVPFVICDATVYTEAGYVGEDVEGILLKLLQRADYDKERAESGIVFIDEFDKLARKSENPSITRDVGGEGVQNTLLKIIEGNVINVPPQGGRKHPYQECIQFDTRKVLFICAGAFLGMQQAVKPSSAGLLKRSLSTTTVNENDLVKYGIIPELVGRLPIVIQLDALSEKELLACLCEPEDNIIGQYQRLLAYDNVELTFTPAALAQIAKQAMQNGRGARSLRHIIENIMTDILFELPRNANPYLCTITRDVVTGVQKAKIEPLF